VFVGVGRPNVDHRRLSLQTPPLLLRFDTGHTGMLKAGIKAIVRKFAGSRAKGTCHAPHVFSVVREMRIWIRASRKE
jgi:hypothetical protein